MDNLFRNCAAKVRTHEIRSLTLVLDLRKISQIALCVLEVPRLNPDSATELFPTRVCPGRQLGMFKTFALWSPIPESWVKSGLRALARCSCGCCVHLIGEPVRKADSLSVFYSLSLSIFK